MYLAPKEIKYNKVMYNNVIIWYSLTFANCYNKLHWQEKSLTFQSLRNNYNYHQILALYLGNYEEPLGILLQSNFMGEIDCKLKVNNFKAINHFIFFLKMKDMHGSTWAAPVLTAVVTLYTKPLQ